MLLLYFTKNHVTIQKIVAYENVFERILAIVEVETLGDGGVVIEDCFRLLHQLLTGNQQNQILFKDGRFVQRLAKLFEVIPQELEESSTWSAQKLVNVSWLLKVSESQRFAVNMSHVNVIVLLRLHESGSPTKLPTHKYKFQIELRFILFVDFS